MLETHESEITAPVDLCLPDGSLNPRAVGWSRHPVHQANLRGWGRTKRWEYWAVQSPDCVLALTVSSIDYLALHTVWFSDFHREIDRTAIIPLGRVTLPRTSGGGEVGVRSGDLQIRIEPTAETIRLRARTKRVRADISVHRPRDHESLGVVIPWSQSRFQIPTSIGPFIRDGSELRHTMS